MNQARLCACLLITFSAVESSAWTIQDVRFDGENLLVTCFGTKGDESAAQVTERLSREAEETDMTAVAMAMAKLASISDAFLVHYDPEAQSQILLVKAPQPPMLLPGSNAGNFVAKVMGVPPSAILADWTLLGDPEVPIMLDWLHSRDRESLEMFNYLHLADDKWLLGTVVYLVEDRVSLFRQGLTLEVDREVLPLEPFIPLGEGFEASGVVVGSYWCLAGETSQSQEDLSLISVRIDPFELVAQDVEGLRGSFSAISEGVEGDTFSVLTHVGEGYVLYRCSLAADGRFQVVSEVALDIKAMNVLDVQIAGATIAWTAISSAYVHVQRLDGERQDLPVGEVSGFALNADGSRIAVWPHNGETVSVHAIDADGREHKYDYSPAFEDPLNTDFFIGRVQLP